MENASNKKRTAVVASAVAAALLLSGTFAWNMATDQTKLNEFQASDPGDYKVELNENFDPSDPWANKDVYVTNISDNPVIVRVRLEEFYDLLYRNGTEYNTPEGFTNGDAGGSAIFNVPAGSTLTGTDADSSTKLDQFVIMHFGEGVVSMADWIAQGKPYADSTGNEYWVIDEDGWCYYTKALSAAENTSFLLDDVDFDKENFERAYDSPYTLDYYINVRLQAMSADLADFGSDTDTAQWTNIGTNNEGRIIAGTENAYESTADQTISDSARALVLGIENPDKSVGKAVATAADLKAVLADPTTDKILLTDDITISSSSEKIAVAAGQTKTIDLGGNTITSTSTVPLSTAKDSTLVVANGTINTGSKKLSNVTGKSTLELKGVEVQSDLSSSPIYLYPDASLVLDGSTVTNATGSAIGLAAGANADIKNSTLSAGADANGIYVSSTTASVPTNVTIENSTVTGGYASISATKKLNLVATGSKFVGGDFGIGSNNTTPAESISLTDCEVESSTIGIFKSDNSPLSLKNCKITVNATDLGGVGIAVRDGDNITLDNVEVSVIGTGVTVTPHTNEEIQTYYNNNSGYDELGFNAFQVVLNSYGNVAITINGGSYTTDVAGADSVVVCESGSKASDSPETFANTITLGGGTEYSGGFAFADSYLNTTVNK